MVPKYLNLGILFHSSETELTLMNLEFFVLLVKSTKDEQRRQL